MFHDDSCARLEACLNSRFRRGQEGAGGIKPRCMRTGSGVWRPAEEKLASPQPASGKLHVVGMGRREILSARGLSVGLGKTPMCAVSVLLPRVPLFASVPPGPGSEIRNMLGWTVLEKTARSGLWWFRGALTKKENFPAFVAAGDLGS